MRGIRVVPEFDIPGHATSWVVAFPELASAPGPYAIERKWGVFNPVLDPTNPAVYALLDGFLGEMAGLFPDEFLHIGGDENNGVQWSANPRIQAFIRENKLQDNAGLHAFFNSHIHAMLARHGKRLVGWDEILHPGLPADSVVHSWRGPDGIAAATASGHATILSNGYYIDLCQPARLHYLNDPVPAGANMDEARRRLVLGGEATMWAEWIDPETIDSRIWPRTAAIADRLWSPREVTNVAPLLRQLAGDQAGADELQALRRFADLLEPVKDYHRGEHQPQATQQMPLTGLADCSRPDSAISRALASAVDDFLADPRAATATAHLTELLANCHDTATCMLASLPTLSPRCGEAEPLLRDLAAATEAAMQAQAAMQQGQLLAAGVGQQLLAAVRRAATPRLAVEFPAAGSLEKLVAAAAGPAAAAPAGK